MTDLQIEGATGRGTPDVSVPIPRQPAPPPAADPPPSSAPPPGEDSVELGRVLRLAGLTPEQAVEVGAGLLAVVAGRTDPDGGDEVPAGGIGMGMDGRVLLRPAPDGGEDGKPPTGSTSGVAVGAVLADIARAARRRSGPDADPLLDRLDLAVVELPGIGLPAVALALDEAAAAADRTVVRAELGALARAIRGSAGPAQRVGPPGAPYARPGSTPPSAPGARRNAGRRIGAWFLSVLVLVGAVLLENALLRDKVATDIGVLLDAGRSGSTPSAAPKPDGLPVVPPAPAAAGVVRGVDLRPLSACTPGAPCTVRLLVRVVAGAGPQVVTWSYRMVDRCTGSVVPVPGGTASVAAGQERVAVVGSVALPAAPALGVVAVTEAPAVAASAPVLVGSCRTAAG